MSAVLKQDYALRPMKEADLDAVMAIEPTIYSHPWSRGNFTDSLQAGYSAWVLILQETIIGYTLMMIVLDEAHLLNISVATPYQKQSLGHMLLEHMLEKAKLYNATDMFLEVRASNAAAIALYESHRFVEVSVRRGYYPAESGREDAVLMGLVIR